MWKAFFRSLIFIFVALLLTQCNSLKPKDGGGGGMGGMRRPKSQKAEDLPSDAVDSPAEENRELERKFGPALNRAHIARDASAALLRNRNFDGANNLGSALGSISDLGSQNAVQSSDGTFDPTSGASQITTPNTAVQTEPVTPNLTTH